MSKRVKRLLLCGMTLPQWIELIIKPHLGILSMCNVRLSCSFFGRSYNLKYLLYTVRKAKTIKRFNCICDMLKCVRFFTIKILNSDNLYRHYWINADNTINVLLHEQIVKKDIISIQCASGDILKTIRDKGNGIRITWDKPSELEFTKFKTVNMFKTLFYERDDSLVLDSIINTLIH